MKTFKYISILLLAGIVGCTDSIDLTSPSNIDSAQYYSTLDELNTALIGCYKGLQKPIIDEWSLTETRSDNTWMANTGSASSINLDFASQDMFFPITANQNVYNYWLNTYNNIYNINSLMKALGASYNESSGVLEYKDIAIPVTDAERKKVAAEASFLRAYHYFNLVRLFGDTFFVHNVVTPDEAKQMNRVPKAEIYKLIIADLLNASANGGATRFSATASDLGRSNSWTAKALLAKVYLTLGRKVDASLLLNNVITNSGYSLLSSYANVFSATNEMNSEILFSVRFKGGGFDMGNPLPNNFAPTKSGSSIINGDGRGLNTPSIDIVTSYSSTAGNIDLRKDVNFGVFGTSTYLKYYVKKYITIVAVINDADSDWPVLRFSDVLLMLAEADGNTSGSLFQINRVRARAGVIALTNTDVNTTAKFETLLSRERRLEFAFENQRWFDLLRQNVTFSTPTLTAEAVMEAHFKSVQSTTFYGKFKGGLTTDQISTNLKNRILLPIPQREIDNNSFLVIPQNPNY